VIAPGMFKLSVSQSVSPISMLKTSCDSNNVKSKLKRKRRKRKSSKQNDKQVNNDVSHANRDFVRFSDLDTFSSVRSPKHSGVIWKKKGSSNTSNVDLSSVSLSKLNKNVKRYSRKDLLSCNNSHLGETSSAYVCNDAMNVSSNSRMCDLFDENNLFIFDDETVRISPVSKMPFRKKPRASMNVRSKSNSNKSLPRTAYRWLLKLQSLAEPIFQIYLWIIDSGCSKHMTGNRASLTNFVEKFLGTVRFGNNDFAVIVGYGEDVGKLKAKGDIGVFVGYSKESAAFRIYKKRTFSETSKKDLEDLFHNFYDEYFDSPKIMKSSTTNVETSNVEVPSNQEEAFHESFESFQEESSSSSLNDNVRQSLEEFGVPSSNTQQISNNLIPNVDEESTSHNVFNERLEDAYFDASTSFHDLSSVYTFYQPYPHEKKWTKDHPLHKIIGDPKSSVRTG
nr:hypothetical protein [Tanacetum cinerariifolium]